MDETQAVINRGNENSINRWSLFSLMIHGLLFDFILIPAFKRKERNNYAGNLGDEIIRHLLTQPTILLTTSHI
jgi:hypothetical protein